jgi:gamma-glutamylcyclotransferase (GGCT)/AIG2-like uncharacterized protein YtfP
VNAVSRGWSVAGQLRFTGRYPALILDGDRKIRGELLLSGSLEEFLRVADEFEGEDYRRVAAEIRRDGGETVIAWVYVYARDSSGLERLAIDEWVEPA